MRDPGGIRGGEVTDIPGNETKAFRMKPITGIDIASFSETIAVAVLLEETIHGVQKNSLADG